MSGGAQTAFPADEWRALLQALCAEDLSSVGTVQDDEPMALVAPTRFAWLTELSWRPVGETFGFAILKLANPGTFPPDAWSQVIGPLARGPSMRGQGPTVQGIVEVPESGNRAAVYLTTDRPVGDPLARVTAVTIRIEPS
jgi:hypothetical protein